MQWRQKVSLKIEGKWGTLIIYLAAFVCLFFCLFVFLFVWLFVCFVFVFPWVQQLEDSYMILYKQALASMFTLLPWYAPPHQYLYPLDSSCCDKLLFIEKDKIYAWKYKDFKKKSQRNFFFYLRGYCTPDQFCNWNAFFSKNYNTLITSKMCFLLVTFQGT